MREIKLRIYVVY